MSPDMEPYTGTWHCPLCSPHIPVTLYGQGEPGRIVFMESPWPMADVAWHIDSEHPDGMDAPSWEPS